MISSSKLFNFFAFLIILNFSGCGSKIENLLSKYENAIEKWGKISEKSSFTIEEVNEINKKNLKLINEMQNIPNESWNDEQREKFIELRKKFSQIILKISHSTKIKNNDLLQGEK